MQLDNELTILPEEDNPAGFDDVGTNPGAVDERPGPENGFDAGTSNSWEFQQQAPDPSALDDQTLLAELQRRQQMQPQPAQPQDPRLRSAASSDRRAFLFQSGDGRGAAFADC